ncbi:MAG: O-methyltransferase [Pseudonocardiales bacterium]|nr:O-methyltransferase [Pseudonocardiales bacterium]
MSAKNQVNAALARLTGHHLVKGAPGAHLDDLRRQLEYTRNELRQARGEPVKPKGSRFPSDFESGAKDIIRAVRPYTMTSNEKLYGLIQATRYIVRNKIPGDIVECGVWRGGSMQAAARSLLEVGDTSRDLFLFDTFEGMTEPSAADVRWDGKSAAELLKTQDKSTWVWAVASLDDVKAGFETVPYPEGKLHYVVGKVEDTIPEQLPERIAILRLDTDWYESTKHELEHAYSRLSPGGILIIDDYGGWAGSRTATDEFLAALDEPLLLHRMSGGRIAVKPFTGGRERP